MEKAVCPGLQPCVSLPWGLDEVLNWLVVLIWPSQAALSGFVSLWMPTSLEKSDPVKLLMRRCTLGPLYALLFVFFLPLALCCIPFRCGLSVMKKPFRYSVCKKDHTRCEEDMMTGVSGPGLGGYQFGIASSNVCLLAEFLARINYVSHAGHRARAIGQRIVVDQFFYGGDPRWASGCPGGGVGKTDSGQTAEGATSPAGGLASRFPRLDILCLQEVFDWNYNKTLRQELHKVFPYMVHEVGRWSVRSNLFLLNSGLAVASRHPVLEADFKVFSRSVSQCLFISKGLLMVKVLIGEETDSQRQVGYVYTTHLQAYQGAESVIVSQLDNIVEWTAEFRRRTVDSRDVVLFDVLCGDFNFDNMSPGDKENRDHPLFDVYLDPCRVMPGQDQPWCVGTELKQLFMHESTATSPESLKASLADPVLRHRHLVDANIMEQSMDSLANAQLCTDQHGNILTFPEAGRRRIDYIISRKDTPIDIRKFQFVTRLASLTDHIPVAMTFTAKV